MLKRILFLVPLLFIIGSPRASFAQSPQTEAIELTPNGAVNWTIGEVSATGIGAPPAAPANAAQARGMAERAAYVVALRNLLETVKGVRVDSESIVENFMVKSDVIRTHVDGIVKGASIVNRKYLSDGSVEITVSISMRGAFMNAVVPETFGRPPTTLPSRPLPAVQKPADRKPSSADTRTPSGPPVKSDTKPQTVPVPSKPAANVPAPGGAPVPALPDKKADKPVEPISKPTLLKPAAGTLEFKGGVATGVVIDGRGLGLKPALLPKIIDQQGQEVYVGQVVTRTNAVEQGVAGYARDVAAASNNFRVTDNPAVIRGIQSSGAAKTDIVIAQTDAETLRKLSSAGDFLQYCRVIIVY